jgi:hypothetical protein
MHRCGAPNAQTEDAEVSTIGCTSGLNACRQNQSSDISFAVPSAQNAGERYTIYWGQTFAPRFEGRDQRTSLIVRHSLLIEGGVFRGRDRCELSQDVERSQLPAVVEYTRSPGMIGNVSEYQLRRATPHGHGAREASRSRRIGSGWKCALRFAIEGMAQSSAA